MEKYLQSLKSCPLFYGIEDENLLRMLHCMGAHIDNYDKRDTIFAEGDPAVDIGIILSGRAQSEMIDYCGNRSILSAAGGGEIFGETFACAEVDELPVSIVATEPTTVMTVDCSHILHTCENNCGFHRQLIYNLMKEMALKNIASHEKIEVTAKRTTRDKLMSFLYSYAKKARSATFEIPFDRQELADYLEVERSGLSSEISKLKSERIIENKKNKFKILK